MRIAVLSDLHGNLPALEAVWADIKLTRPDLTVCLGDLSFKGPWPGECVAFMRDLGIPCVHGNTDLGLLDAAGRLTPDRLPAGWRRPEGILPYYQWHLARLSEADLGFLEGLPSEHRIAADGQNLLCVHANPRDCLAGIVPCSAAAEIADLTAGEEADWLVMGHVHQAFAFRFGGRWLVNTGAVGFSLDRDWRASYALVDTGAASVTLRRVEYSIEQAVSEARARSFCFDPDWYGEALRQGWWEPVPWPARAGIDRFPRCGG